MIKFLKRLFRKKENLWRKDNGFYKPRAILNRKNYDYKKGGIENFFKKIIIVGIIFLAFYLLFFSQIFAIKKIEIEGNKSVSADNIEKFINNKIFQPQMNFLPGNNFFLCDSEKIKKELLNEFIEFRSVEVSKKFFNTLKVKITEKDPLIIWCRLESCYYVDKNGIAFLSAEKEPVTERDRVFIKITEQQEIEEEAGNSNPENENQNSATENKKKNDVTYNLDNERFEKVRLFFVGEEQNDWVATYPILFSIAGEDMKLPVLSESEKRSYTYYSLDFAKKTIDNLKRIQVRDKSNKKTYYIRINFNYENKSIFVNIIEEAGETEEKQEKKIAVFGPIKTGEAVSDSDFINFATSIDQEIKNKTTLKIKYYKTKGTRTKELIAYTDKNTRIYFSADDNADSQVDYLKEFLSKGIKEKNVDTLEYIYLKSGNKIFYK